MEGQLRMFRLAVEAMTYQCHFEPGHGWQLEVRVRRGDEDWGTCHRASYDSLSTPELAQALCDELETALGL